MKPVFMEGALKKVSSEVAEGIWDRMVTFGRYGFSVIHACFSVSQMIMTKSGPMGIKDAYDTGTEIAYEDNGEIKYEKSTHWFDQGEKEVFQIEMEDGSLIECTEDHKFMDEDGSWITAKEAIERGHFYAK